MRLMFAGCLVAALAVTVSGDCNACIDGLCYKKQLLPNATGNHAAVDRNTNTLSVIDKQRRLIKKCVLDTVTCTSLPNQMDIRTIAVDQRTSDINGSVYPGRGIYKIDFVNKTKVLVDRTARVWRMAFMDKIYYSSYRGMYTSEGGRSHIVSGTENYDVIQFTVDKKHKIYLYDYLTAKTYSGKLNGGDVSRSVLPHNYFHWTIDNNGNDMVFELHTDIIYRVKDERSVEVGALNETGYHYDHIFDGDNNLIYTVKEQRYILRINNASCTTSVMGNKRMITETVDVSPVLSSFTTSRPTGNSGISDTGIL